MRIFYSIGFKIYVFLVHVASLWNPKAKKWVNGRKESWKKLEHFQIGLSDEKCYWFHCASLGEFEQGRPLIEGLKQREKCKIVISFFSPSGYEIRKNYELADLIVYLPNDSKKNANRFFDLLNPTQIFFIKYEFWASYIFEARKRNIPFYSVAAVFRPNQIFFKWYGGFMRTVLKEISQIFVQDSASQNLLKGINIDSLICGDTRYDRVMANAKKAQRFEKIDAFVTHHRVMICGSVWTPDLKVIAPILNHFNTDWKIIIAPHEIDEQHLEEVENSFENNEVVRYSRFNNLNTSAKILLIDNIGMLMHLYGYADVAYVGGAFKTGLHNILEPASFGLPVIFGPHHSKFPEAKLFIDTEIGFSISNSKEFELVVLELQKKNMREKVLTFMNSKLGATQLILEKINTDK